MLPHPTRQADQSLPPHPTPVSLPLQQLTDLRGSHSFIFPQYLLDQTDVLVVGVLGLQGTGKSMVMSLLSANTPEEDQR